MRTKYMWIRVGNKWYCVRGRISTCFRAHFAFLPQDSRLNERLQRATISINTILDELAREDVGPNRELHIVAVESAENDRYELALVWASTDEEVEISNDA